MPQNVLPYRRFADFIEFIVAFICKYFFSELGDKIWVTVMTGLLSLDLSREIFGVPLRMTLFFCQALV